ncbi:MAG: MFS transporter [Actinobacteria bacterium]|nr:MFS transporter [Actinomycetota bacterium]
MTSTPESPRPTDHDARSVQRTTAVFLLCHGLRWLPIGFAIPILVLVPTERGLDLPTVGLVFAAYGVTTALLELPTGGLADAVGRKPVLLVATVADTGLLLALAFGSSAWHFVAGAVVGGVGRALLTGPLESWYVDTVRALDPAIPLRPGLSSAGLVEGVALAAGALLSALLPTIGAGLPVDGVVSQLTLPVYGGLVAEVASFVAVLILLHEPARSSHSDLATEVRAVPTIVAGGLRLAVRTRDLRLLSAVFVISAVAMVGVEVLWQPRFAVLLGSTAQATQTFGYVVVGMSLGAAGGAWLADRLPGVLARRAAVAAASGTALAAAAMVGLAFATSFAAAAAAFIAVYAAAALGSVAEAEALHERVPSSRRATMVSAQSLAQQLGNVIASLGLTRVAAAQGIPFAWGVGATLLVVSSALLLFVRERAPAPADTGAPR